MEANVICGTNRDPNDIDLSTSHMSAEAHGTLTSPPDSPESPDSFAVGKSSSNHAWSTWRLSGRFDFSYANFPRRQHHGIRRQPNPFAESMASFSRLTSDDGHGDSSTSPNNHKRTDHGQMQMQGFGVLVEQDLADYTADPVSTAASNPTVLVSRHPPHPAWNDESDPNHPYDNPYYTRPVNNALWLPRDPCGLLDLDDTVDVKMSLTTLSSAGQLGVWVVPGGPQLMETGPSPPSSPQLPHPDGALSSSPEALEPMMFAEPHSQFSNNSPYFTRHLDGSEEISLPPAIASRVSAIDKEDDIDYAYTGHGKPRRPTILGLGGRKRSSDKSVKTIESPKESASIIRRQHTLNVEQPSASTDGAGGLPVPMSSRTRVTSVGTSHTISPPSSFLGRRGGRSGSLDHELGIGNVSSLLVQGGGGSGPLVGPGVGSVGQRPMVHVAGNLSNLTIPGSPLSQPVVGPPDQTSSGIGVSVPVGAGVGAGTGSRLGLGVSGLSVSGGGNAHDRVVAAVTMQEVVQEEAIVEEQEAAEERAKKEREEVEKESRQHKSWLTRWLFSDLEDVSQKGKR